VRVILTLVLNLFAKRVSSGASLDEAAALEGGCDALKLRSFDVDTCCRRRLVCRESHDLALRQTGIAKLSHATVPASRERNVSR